MDIDKELKALFDDPLLNVSEEEKSLFDIPQDMRRVIAKKKADYVAQHKLCENFDEYKSLFAKVHRELKQGLRSLVKITKTATLSEGRFYFVSGQMLLLEKIGELKKSSNFLPDARTRCIYENGTESDILLQTLRKNVVGDGYAVTELQEDANGKFFSNSDVTADDKVTGYIYVLSSLSQAPAIKEVKVLTGDDTGKASGAITAAISDKKITFTVENTVKAGTYQVKVVFKSSEISGEVTVVATLNVVDTSKVADSDATFMLELPTDAIDLAIAPGTKAADLENKKINISVVEYKLGAKVSTLEGATITIKNPKGTEVGNGTKLYTVNGNNIIKNITELGTYTVEAKAIVKDAKGNDVEKKFSGSFTVKDTQLSASASIKKTSDIAANGSDAAALAKNVLEQSEVAEFTFDGKKIANATISNATAKVNGKALYIEKAYVTVTDATTGATYDVPVAINASFTLR